MTEPSSSILQRIASGDADAVQECIDAYGGLIWSVARRLIAGQGEAEDAVQDVFIEIWKSAGRFDPSKSSEKSFVVMIARRRIIDRLRRVTRRIDSQGIDEDAPEPGSDQHVDMERGVEATLAARALEELPPVRREVLELSIYKGMTHSEIADAISMPLGTVKSHINRGLASVRDMLSGDSTEGGG